MGFFQSLKDDFSTAVNELVASEDDFSPILPGDEPLTDEPALPAEEPLIKSNIDAEESADYAEEPAIEEPAIEEPAIEELAIEEPAAEEFIQEPAADFIEETEESAEEPAAENDQVLNSLVEAYKEKMNFSDEAIMSNEEFIPETINEKEIKSGAFTEIIAEEAPDAPAAEPEAELPKEEEQAFTDLKKETDKMEDEIFDEVISDETAIITAGMTIKGNVESNGNMDLAGAVEGNINIKGKLNIAGKIYGDTKAGEVFADSAEINGNVSTRGSVKVGQSTVIIGNISSKAAVIAGAVKGDIDVHGPVILDSTAIVMGNIKSASVQINNGAVIEGLCSQCYATVSPTSFFEEFKKSAKKL